MNKDEALKLINESDTDDWHVVSQKDHDTFLTNFRDTEVSKGIKDEISKVHQRYEDDIKSVLGVEKPHDVKTYDFLKQQLGSLSGDIQTKNEEISKLQKAVDDKSGDEALKLLQSNYEALQKKYQKSLDEFKTERDGYQGEVNRIKLMNEADHALIGIKFLSSVPEDARKALIEIAKNEVVKDASYLDNNVVFLDENNSPMRDDQLNIITMEMRLRDKLKSIIDKGVKQPGVDIKEPVTKDEDGKITVNVTVPDSVKTMEQLIEHLQTAGLARNTDEYYEALKFWKDKLKL